ncbi:alpha-ketoglutarate-dependent dioxygenase AlkB family protein [Algirhabdus cladophorae]|uniref:alpha-ketoglutarate-dependent dioxygenase AlkB family protein n=1 Tax=Algirhabdus cladophorae TaxID=3377108 RepID=UPI003B845669
MVKPTLKIKGFAIYKGFLDRLAQERLVEDIRQVAQAAPFVSPITPSGQKMSVRMTAAGPYGWITDRRGYRYAKHHPNGQAWPDMPPSVIQIWQNISEAARAPECCLINYYSEAARMGLHQDKDEASFDWPVVSVSLGDEALFRMGGETRGDPTQSVWLASGDVVVMGGAARRSFHGVDRIKFGSSALLSKGGRINLTMRIVT